MDTAIDELHNKAQAVLPLIAKKTQELEGLKASLKTAKEKSMTYSMKKKDLEAQVEDKEKLIKKHQGELNSLKSNDAYKAMLGEIQAAKDAQAKIEDDILNLMEAIDTADKDYKSTEQKLKSDENVIKTQIQDLEKQKADLESENTKKKEERTTFSASISAGSLTQYESIRVRRGGVAIVPLIANSCGGCRMNMTQNQLIQIKKAKEVVYCNNCTRIIYVPAPDVSVTPPQQPSIPAA